MNILIAEDHPLYVIGIESMLLEYKSDANIFKVADFRKALRLFDLHKFDLVIMDIVLPHGNKVGMVDALRLKQPKTVILVCSAYEEHLYALTYLKAGANGYISKTAASKDFKIAVQQVMNGKIYASENVLSTLFEMLFKSRNDDNLPIYKLSEKEAEIARQLSKGLSTKQIGESINLSSSSVSNYKTKIFQKLGVTNIIELIAVLDLKS